MDSRGSLLVFRFSAMGDVAMSASVLKEFSKQHPDLKIIIVSRALFKPFFEDIENLQFHNLEPDTKHKGLKGLYTLYQELKTYKPIAVADLHNNLRSNVLSFYFRFFKSLPTAKIDKGRSEKKALTRKENKVLKPLKSTPERYADVFRKLGFKFKLSHQLKRNRKTVPISQQHHFQSNNDLIIGISPFAKHKEKVYPLEKMELVIQELSKIGYKIFIFGGGPEEAAVAETWEEQYKEVHSLIGKLTLSEELQVISNLNLMVGMDSAGMHMASLMGVSVISVWGATHPFAGFMGYGQLEEDCVQIDLYCRPCSVFGNKPCYRGDHACMHGIDSGMIVERIIGKLNNDQRSFSY